MAKAVRKGYASGVSSGASTTFTVTPAADLVDGDWMFFSAAVNGTTNTVTPPSGWVTFGDSNQGSNTSGTRRFYLFGKRRIGSETTYQFTTSSAVVVAWSIVYGSGGVTSPSEWVNGGME